MTYRTLLKSSAAKLATYSGLAVLRRRSTGLVVLMLHKVCDRFDPLPLTISCHLFAQLLDEISCLGHKFVRLDQWVSDRSTYRDGKLRFAVTFDDGYRDNYTNAFPILRARNIPATVYLSVDHIERRKFFWHETLSNTIMRSTTTTLDLRSDDLGRFTLSSDEERRECLTVLNQELKTYTEKRRQGIVENIASKLDMPVAGDTSEMLTWEMISEMRSHDIQFGSHTMSHPILSRESAERVVRELVDSKREIENHLKDEVFDFAYPNGTEDDFNSAVVAEVRNAGYLSACTTITGTNNDTTDPYLLKRINVHNGMCTKRNGQFDRHLFWAKILHLF